MENKSLKIERPDSYLRALSSAHHLHELKPTIGATDLPVLDNPPVAKTNGTGTIYLIVGVVVVVGIVAYFICTNDPKDKTKENSKDEGRKADAPIANNDVEVKPPTGENSIQPNQNRNVSFGSTDSLFNPNV